MAHLKRIGNVVFKKELNCLIVNERRWTTTDLYQFQQVTCESASGDLKSKIVNEGVHYKSNQTANNVNN